MLRDKGGQASPRQSTKPSEVISRQETPREKQQRIRQAAQRNRESNFVDQVQELLKYSGSGSNFQESSIPKRPSTYGPTGDPIRKPQSDSGRCQTPSDGSRPAELQPATCCRGIGKAVASLHVIGDGSNGHSPKRNGKGECEISPVMVSCVA